MGSTLRISWGSLPVVPLLLLYPVACIFVRAVPEIILGVGGPQALFCPVGGGRFVDNGSEGWAVTCPGGQGVFDP